MSEGCTKDHRRIYLRKTAFLPKVSAICGGQANKKAKSMSKQQGKRARGMAVADYLDGNNLLEKK